MKNHLLVPYLMGQRRDRLSRVRDLDSRAWEVLAIPDLHEVSIPDANEQMRRMGKVYANLANAVVAVVASGAVPVCIAGDCVSTLGMLAGLQQAGKAPDRILWLDAHGDFHTYSTTQTQYIGGMPLAMMVGQSDGRKYSHDTFAALRAAIGVTPYPEQQVILSDARDLDPGEKEALAESGVIRCSIQEVALHLVPGERLYLHFDTDVLDAEADMPALKYHVKEGPTYADITALLQSLRSKNIVAISMSAWHAEQDVDDKTAMACIKLLNEVLP
ncbi:arginase family protein [Solimicrobium silvestre]|uniref:Arginase family n=1 Tax=Solimicrobium silvestre TaxID=2099400 RepID=A0A2S9GXS5_9BURK|nr:arginase family protein [Solimicrobium silvestre]PRC92508.1 Arginase family [Solimicrobium silvestre]